ncbi:WhiB family transcriptional regulator [Streptomyces sp. NBC_01221]|uniref:WhiB family transcriptional regulator n=1 Tax=Streptomyces sp. NBC_01221 TaxID=2903782 RepID=UPI0022590F4F|nr:WhiB family transcriptional regulator [Streptomyces sp. NBC_01221]MCX4792588.1 WhiB family transcriptional regulator [Streptomyces sp. NBC_01221]
MIAAHPPARTRAHGMAEDDIAQYVASTEPIDNLVASGYLAGHDGRLIAQQLRAPQLHQAVTHSVCHAVKPDVDNFYQEDGEPDSDWHRRRTRTVRDHCTVCPVRAACAELALRDDDTVGIRGGLAPEKLHRRLLTEATRLDRARSEDQRAAQEQQARIAAAAEVQRLAGQYIGTSVPTRRREQNHQQISEAVQRRDELFAARRRAASWAEAA